jgi:NAD(P)-dependent dehydrogenase (short-subunit alcohol dehydrogenase family)
MNILIHAGAGGVGLMATQYAINAGCNVYITCSDEKRQFIDKRVEQISTSRNANQFKNDFTGTNIRFDIVLNSLSDDYIKYSFDLTKEGGVFIEIGKRNIWSILEAKSYRSDIIYHQIAIDTEIATNPTKIRKMLETIKERDLKPINIRTFPLTRAVDGFKYLQSGKNVGKVVINCAKPLRGSYIITGGSGVLGQITAKYLISSGVDKVYLVSRSGKVTDLDMPEKCQIINMDLTLEANIIKLLELPNIRGIIHASGVLRDDIFTKQTP